MKTKIIFYDDEPFFLEENINILKGAGFDIEIFSSAEDLLARVKKDPEVALIISELVVHGPGNNFGGKRHENLEDCATMLADELDKIPEMKETKKMVFTSWGHISHGRLLVGLKKMRGSPTFGRSRKYL